MFEYNTPLVNRLADTARRDYRDGATAIRVNGNDAPPVTVHRDAVIVTPNGDIINAVRAFFYAVDIDGVDVLQTIEDADAVGFDITDAIADAYADAVNGFDIVENADGSAHAVAATATPKRVTDTTAVIVKKADGTTTVTRQTAYDALAVIVEGQRKVLAEIEEGTRNNYRDDIDAELVTN